MDRRDFLGLAGWTGLGLTGGAAMSSALASRARAAARKPNIIYLMLDELGYYELSCMGHKILRTPNADRMAREGMRFTQALAGGCVCAPTRCALMTGKHLGHASVRGNSGSAPIRADEETIASVLRRAGYATGGFGKWGIGDRGTSGVPEKHGFDVFFGYYHQVHAHTYYPRYLLRNSALVPLEGNTGNTQKGQTFSHHVIYDESIRFIRENRDRPFFCYLPWTPPHGLWGFPEGEPAWQLFKDKPWTAGQRTRNDAKVYAAMVSMIDRQLGEIFGLLKELGIDEDTMVFFCGDNGGQAYFKSAERPHGFFAPNLDPRTGVRFRGGKGNLYEGGLRVPMIVRWPGKIAAGRVSDHLWYFPDVMPTLAEIAGADAPADTDGISIVPTLLGERSAGRGQEEHEYLYWVAGGTQAVRMRNWKLIVKGKKRLELYDLDKDVGETRNIADEHPDIVEKMTVYAKQANTPMVRGKYLDRSKLFRRRQEYLPG